MTITTVVIDVCSVVAELVGVNVRYDGVELQAVVSVIRTSEFSTTKYRSETKLQTHVPEGNIISLQLFQ